MRKLLLGGAAALLVGFGAYALDDDTMRTRIHVADGSQIHMGDGQGTIVEIRGANGGRTVHISSSGDESILEIDGQVIEIDDGTVLIDGEEVADGRGAFVIVEGDEVRVIEGDVHLEFDARHRAHAAERAEHAARLAENLTRHTLIEIDLEGLEEEIMDSLHAAFEDLPHDLEDAEYDGRDWDDLSDEEREEVREALEEAREEIREAMRDVRIELREAAREVDHARHVEVRVHRELERAEREMAREMARAERDMARAERDAARAARDAERAERDRERRHHRYEIRREFYDHDAVRESDVDSLRIEMGDDGRRRIWVNGEEQVGDDLTDWLNRLEAGRLEGGE